MFLFVQLRPLKNDLHINISQVIFILYVKETIILLRWARFTSRFSLLFAHDDNENMFTLIVLLEYVTVCVGQRYHELVPCQPKYEITDISNSLNSA